jgi:hypothetical protein
MTHTRVLALYLLLASTGAVHPDDVRWSRARS